MQQIQRVKEKQHLKVVKPSKPRKNRALENTALNHPKFFNRYVEKVSHGSIHELMEQSYSDLLSDLEILEKYDFNYSYQEDKWSIAKLIRHCIDTEQIFGYRALCIARQDPNPIMSFDENQFADASGIHFDKQQLIEGLNTARKQNMLMFKSFDPSWFNRNSKTDNGQNLSLISVAYIIIGHWLHHKSVLTERYGIQFK